MLNDHSSLTEEELLNKLVIAVNLLRHQYSKNINDSHMFLSCQETGLFFLKEDVDLFSLEDLSEEDVLESIKTVQQLTSKNG